jgi:peroxiredoxin
MKSIRNYGCLLLVFPLLLGTAAAVVADERPGFPELPPRTVSAAPFSDDQVDRLLTILDSLLAEDAKSAVPGEDAATDLWTFRERLQTGVLSVSQEARVVQHLERAAAEYPGLAAAIARERTRVTSLAVGKPAPDIIGKDLDGQEFHLSDYRGRVVVITFSGEWCGACRVEYPYQRLLMELYRDRPLTILGVNSDKDAQTAREAKVSRGLTYRSWWDGYAEKNTRGPIASAWGVMGWPTTYVIDEQGIIRFVNLRQEDLLKGVKQLMAELTAGGPKSNSEFRMQNEDRGLSFARSLVSVRQALLILNSEFRILNYAWGRQRGCEAVLSSALSSHPTS